MNRPENEKKKADLLDGLRHCMADVHGPRAGQLRGAPRDAVVALREQRELRVEVGPVERRERPALVEHAVAARLLWICAGAPDGRIPLFHCLFAVVLFSQIFLLLVFRHPQPVKLVASRYTLRSSGAPSARPRPPRSATQRSSKNSAVSAAANALHRMASTRAEAGEPPGVPPEVFHLCSQKCHLRSVHVRIAQQLEFSFDFTRASK